MKTIDVLADFYQQSSAPATADAKQTLFLSFFFRAGVLLERTASQSRTRAG